VAKFTKFIGCVPKFVNFASRLVAVIEKRGKRSEGKRVDTVPA
jgi:hypothetical protein